MYIRFNVKNFLSFSDRVDPDTQESRSQEFSMIPGSVRGKPEHLIEDDGCPVLKLGVLLGASGKSDLLQAFSFLRDMVLVGSVPPEASCLVRYPDQPSYFEVEFSLSGESYAYGFEVLLSSGVIVSEWLYRISGDHPCFLFQKASADDSYVLRDVLSGLDSGVDKHALLLTSLRLQSPLLADVFDWIVTNLEVIDVDSDISDCFRNSCLDVAFASGRAVIVGEGDSRMSVSLVKRFLEKRDVQLIFTTDDTRLLDLTLLRRDEIWFVHSRPTGESDIYSLDEFTYRFDGVLDRAYLEGRFC